jgi:von Willebrand factor type D domain
MPAEPPAGAPAPSWPEPSRARPARSTVPFVLGWRTWTVIAAVALGAAAAPAAQAADSGLVPPRAEVPGFTAAGSGAGVARSALGGTVPGALRRARAQGAAYRSGSRRLAFGAFSLSSSRAAAAALSAAGRGGRSVRIGPAPARLRVRTGRRSTDAVVVLRVGSAVGAVRFRLAVRSAATASAVARGYADTLRARLSRQLSLTAWQQTLDSIGAGPPTPAQALRAFAIAYGPLPGAPRPKGPLGVPPSATLAMRLVDQAWNGLTPAQRNAIDLKLGAPHDPSSPRIAGQSAQVLTPSPKYQALANKYNALYRAKLPSAAPVTVKAFSASEDITTPKGAKALADALTVNAAGEWGVGAPAYCRVRVPPFGASQSPAFLELILAHEIFHCYQAALMANWRTRSAWIIEGMADWAAVTIDPVPASVGAGPYKLYLSTPATTVFDRAYDGSGFWGHVDEAFGAGSLWAKIPSILGSPDDVSAFLLAGGGDLPSIETWASAMFRHPGAGSPWNQRKPFAISSGSLPLASLDVSSSAPLNGATWSTLPYTIHKDSTQNLVLVSKSTGWMRVGTPSRDYGMIDGSEWFCFGTCKCPKGYESTIPENKKIAGGKLLAGVSSGAAFAAGSVEYRNPKDFCSKKKPPPGPAESNGDPHLTSLDGLHFDFQAAGEFVLVRARSGDLEIQARQEQYEDRPSVSVNTQMAMRVSGRRVTVSPGPTKDSQPAVRIDGVPNPVAAGAPVALGGGASIARDATPEGDVDVAWPDGSHVDVRPVGKWGVAGRVELASERANQVNGLLGDFDGNPRNDLATRAGKRIGYTAEKSGGWGFIDRYVIPEEFTKKFFADLYDKVGDSWRISQAASLFDYGPGQSTKTFTKRDFPQRPLDPDELRAAKRAAAERICRAAGVTEAGPLRDCITDVAATGNAAFAKDAALAQEAAKASWTKLRAGADRNRPVSLLRTGDGALHVAFEEQLDGPAYRMLNVPVDAAGREGAAELIENLDGEPALLAGPDGSVRALSAELRQSPPLLNATGVFAYARGAAGAWSAPGQVTDYGSSYAGRPQGLYVPDGTLLTVSPMAGVGRLFRNTGTPNEGVALNAAAPDCYATSPTLARDGATGAVWAAWVQWDCPQIGVFVQQVDPATGALAGPALKAPGSSWRIAGRDGYAEPGLDENLAFTGRPGQPGVFLAFAADNDARVRLWRVGAPATTAVAKQRISIGQVMLTPEPGGGRLWLGWSESNRLWLQRTTAAGALAGSPRPLDPPRGSNAPILAIHTWDIAGRRDGVDVLYGFRRDGDTPGGLWNAQISP